MIAKPIRVWHSPKSHEAPPKIAPFIGIGTGRCGTLSLCNIVASCYNTTVLHEGYMCHWDKTFKPMAIAMTNAMKSFGTYGVSAGNVSFHLIRWVEDLMVRIPNLKVICLHRDKEATVSSFTKCFVDGSPFATTGNKGIVNCFPDIDTGSFDSDVKSWWNWCEKKMENIPNSYHIEPNDLNSDSEVKRLYDYLGIIPSDRIIPEQRRYNAL